MRILLVNPASDNAFSKVGFIVPPLGLAYVASSLREAGHDVAVHDCGVEYAPPAYGSYDLVGISGDTFRHGKVLAIAAEARSAGAKVAVGGPHATFLDEETLKDPNIDFVVRGEAEETMPELASAIEKDTPLQDVKGITFKENSSIVRTPDRQPPDDLDALPLPARDLLQMGRYRSLEMAGRKMTSIISSRGCPSGCSFCSSHRYAGKKWRARSAASLMDEISLVIGKYGYGGVAFVDDNFTLDPRRVIELSKAIIDEGVDIKWWCFSRTDTIVRNPEMVHWMGKSGCRYVFMGIESANQTTLDSFSKKSSRENAEKAVRILKENQIETLAAYILGSPDETREMVEETIRYSVKLDTGGVQYTLLTPYPGTQLFEEMRGRLLTEDWSLFDCTHPVLRSDHLKPEELQELLFKAYKSFYIRPKRVAISLLSAIRGRGVKISQVKELIKSFK